MYDPVVGVMLSPDRFMTDPLQTDDYNLFAYAWNNPLKYTDPTGWNEGWFTWEDEEGQHIDWHEGKSEDFKGEDGIEYKYLAEKVRFLDEQGNTIGYGDSDGQRKTYLATVVVTGTKKPANPAIKDGDAGDAAQVIQRSQQVAFKAGQILNSPVGNARISSEFKSHRTCSECSQTHGGTDYAVPINTRVVATAGGIVARRYKSSSYGNVVIINHGPSRKGKGNVYTLYAHGNSIEVADKQKVQAGQLVLKSGNTGNSTGPHLHYEVVVTTYSPTDSKFFGNLKIRHAPADLKYFLTP